MYAAGDAASSLEIFYALLGRENLGGRVDTTGLKVDDDEIKTFVKG